MKIRIEGTEQFVVDYYDFKTLPEQGKRQNFPNVH